MTAGLALLTTVAVNACVWIVEIEAVAGVTVTPIYLTVTFALLVLVGSSTLVAVMK